MKNWVLYEDNHLIIVNKPSRIPVQGDKTGDETLLDIVKSYIILNVTDARGLNISGIDIRIKEGDSVKYSTDYFGGNDPKTDSNGTIETFLINSKET